jgi:alanine racemase
MGIVKADGYGHGAIECSRTLIQGGCTFLAVFAFDEALALRDAGIETEIMIFSRMQKDFIEDAVSKNITLNLSGVNDILMLEEFEKQTGTNPKFHLKVDTGMNRLGIPFDKANDLLRKISANQKLNCEGIYSHYATADEGDLTYAEWQLEQFKLVLSLADEIGLKFKYRHFSNSGTITNMSDTNFDIVRVGMLLYGAFPSDEVPTDLDIKPVMEFRGPIVSLRRVTEGTKVSYGGVWESGKDTTIGVIQTGFADGFPRNWYKSGYVVYKGKPYSIAGRICMDQFMVDFGDDRAEIGDEVLLFGENGNDSLHMEEIAQQINSTPYVLSTGIHGRTERVYLP